jgi:hypothetical protein
VPGTNGSITRPRAPRVAMCGTFDVQNYGDLLFPLILKHELGKRIPGIEVECFSYHAKSPPGWPFEVSPVNSLPEAVSSFDAVVVGGGHLIRFDKEVAPGYFPPLPEMHHPTSYWLFPALVALDANVRLIWSAVGASPELPQWGRELLKEVLNRSAYVSVRDEISQRLLRDLGTSTKALNVPDSAFGVRGLCTSKFDRRGKSAPYVAIQATPNLKPYAETIQRLVLWLAEHNYQVVPLCVSPALGDEAEVLGGILGQSFPSRSWIDPIDVAGTIANAAAVVGVSLHLTITALTFGVPVLRPFRNPVSKYTSVHDLPGVFALEAYPQDPDPVHRAIQRGPLRAPEVEKFYAALAEHWDSIARILMSPPAAGPPALTSILNKLPFWLENVPAAKSKSRRFW